MASLSDREEARPQWRRVASSGERAAELITSSVSADLNVVNFDEVEAFRLKVKLRELVSVAPTDNGMSRSS